MGAGRQRGAGDGGGAGARVVAGVERRRAVIAGPVERGAVGGSTVAAGVNGALGYGFSSIVVPSSLTVMSPRRLNPTLVMLEVALNGAALVSLADDCGGWDVMGLTLREMLQTMKGRGDEA